MRISIKWNYQRCFLNHPSYIVLFVWFDILIFSMQHCIQTILKSTTACRKHKNYIAIQKISNCSRNWNYLLKLKVYGGDLVKWERFIKMSCVCIVRFQGVWGQRLIYKPKKVIPCGNRARGQETAILSQEIKFLPKTHPNLAK